MRFIIYGIIFFWIQHWTQVTLYAQCGVIVNWCDVECARNTRWRAPSLASTHYHKLPQPMMKIRIRSMLVVKLKLNWNKMKIISSWLKANEQRFFGEFEFSSFYTAHGRNAEPAKITQFTQFLFTIRTGQLILGKWTEKLFDEMDTHLCWFSSQ